MILYFIRSAARVKIGVTENVARRVAQLQTGNAHTLEVLATLDGATFGLEKLYHSALAEWRLRGEWFAYEGPVMRLVLRIVEGARPFDLASINHYLTLAPRREPTPAPDGFGRIMGEIRQARKANPDWQALRKTLLAKGDTYALGVAVIDKKLAKS